MSIVTDHNFDVVGKWLKQDAKPVFRLTRGRNSLFCSCPNRSARRYDIVGPGIEISTFVLSPS